MNPAGESRSARRSLSARLTGLGERLETEDIKVSRMVLLYLGTIAVLMGAVGLVVLIVLWVF